MKAHTDVEAHDEEREVIAQTSSRTYGDLVEELTQRACFAECSPRARGVGAQEPYIPRIEEDGTYAAHNLYDLVQKCDIVSLHTPATPRTRGFVNREMVELMRPGAILINTARKEIVDENELLPLLMERTDLSYLTDIRPDRHDEFAAALGNRYYATPKKLGAQTAEANANAGLAAARQIVGFFATGDTTFRVNR